ncbi:MAG: hypothetical protein Q7K26_03355 [bacterium]|nr:hypothetical protein [bacterium]
MIKFPLKRAATLLKRAWRIYVMPPKETRVYLDYKQLPVISTKLANARTALEPKQVTVDHARMLAYVSCMKGQKLQEFSFAQNNLILTNEWLFTEQCVECDFWNGLILLTTTNFKRGNDQKSHLWVFDPVTGTVVSKIDTQGEWSKVIVVDDEKRIAFVSNWHSNDISVIDLSDITHPKVIQKVSCAEAPRGMVIRPDGTLIATSFYGRGIFAIAKSGKDYQITRRSAQFDPTGYGGNMRDILFSPDKKTVCVSNLGRNMVHWYDAQTLELIESLSTPRQPNSMRFMKILTPTIGVSCRKDNLIFFFDEGTKKPIGVSAKTEKLPTGLTAVENGFIVTNFDNNSIELHRVRYR